MKKITVITIIIILCTGYLFASGFGENDSTKNKISYWLGLGIGSNYFGPTLSMNLSFTVKHNLFMIKYSKSDEFRFGVENNFDEPPLTLKEIGILYGRYFRKNNLLLSASFGVSYLNGVNRGKNIQYNDFEKTNISTVGFPFEAEAMFEFTRYTGIGILFYGNINNKKLFTGGMLRIKIGYF